MENQSGKKWFVYLEDHHEGPFTMAEIQQKMTSGALTRSTYVWCDGMPDWKIMTEVSEFDQVGIPEPLPNYEPTLSAAIKIADPEPFASHASEGPSVHSTPEQGNPLLQFGLEPPHESLTESSTQSSLSLVSDLEQAPSPFGGLEKTGKTSKTKTKNSNFEPASLTAVQQTQAQTQDKEQTQQPSQDMPKPKKRIRLRTWFLIFILLLTSIVGAGMMGYLSPITQNKIYKDFAGPMIKQISDALKEASEPYVFKAVEKVPFLAQWVTPIAELTDVSPEDYNELKAAALAGLDTQGPKAAFAISKTDLQKPSFYVATNLPDGAGFDVYLYGDPDTLLNQLQFNSQAKAVVVKRLGKTQNIQFNSGEAVPAGEYNVYVFESAEQPDATKKRLNPMPPSSTKTSDDTPDLPMGRKIVLRKKVFLGGKNDANYAQRLKDYHLKLKEKADQEVAETKLFLTTLENALSETNQNFNNLKAKNTKKLAVKTKKEWQAFSDQWTKLVGELSEKSKKWSPQQIENEFFYGVLYQLTAQAADAVLKVHSEQSLLFNQKILASSYDIQLGATTANAQAAITALQAKLKQVSELGTTPRGLPRKAPK